MILNIVKFALLQISYKEVVVEILNSKRHFISYLSFSVLDVPSVLLHKTRSIMVPAACNRVLDSRSSGLKSTNVDL